MSKWEVSIGTIVKLAFSKPVPGFWVSKSDLSSSHFKYSFT